MTTADFPGNWEDIDTSQVPVKITAPKKPDTGTAAIPEPEPIILEEELELAGVV